MGKVIANGESHCKWGKSLQMGKGIEMGQGIANG
jgi:hypothetical protein